MEIEKIAITAAKEWLCEMRDGMFDDEVPQLASIISRAITAAVKGKDERIAELEGALKPFADALHFIEASDEPEEEEVSMRFTVAQFERAAQALRKT